MGMVLHEFKFVGDDGETIFSVEQRFRDDLDALDGRVPTSGVGAVGK
jgi:hypothetical protein